VASPAAAAAARDDEVGRAGTGAGRIAAVEAEVRVLRDEVGALRARLEALERDAG
jgi:ubiquinone biosynthesis protein UbiJ